MLQTCTGPTHNVVIVILCLLYVHQGRAIREEINCQRFVKRVAEVNFVTAMSVAHVFKSHDLIFGGN